MLKSTEQALSEAYGLALLDLDGVVYRGKNPVDHGRGVGPMGCFFLVWGVGSTGKKTG